MIDLLVFNANFSSISAISWRELILQINRTDNILMAKRKRTNNNLENIYTEN